MEGCSQITCITGDVTVARRRGPLWRSRAIHLLDIGLRSLRRQDGMPLTRHIGTTAKNFEVERPDLSGPGRPRTMKNNVRLSLAYLLLPVVAFVFVFGALFSIDAETTLGFGDIAWFKNSEENSDPPEIPRFVDVNGKTAGGQYSQDWGRFRASRNRSTFGDGGWKPRAAVGALA